MKLGLEQPRQLVDINALAVAHYLEEQIAAGADAVMIFDTWGGLLGRDAYRRFSLAPVARVLSHLATSPRARDVPTIVFTKGAGGRLDDLVTSGASALGLEVPNSMQLLADEVIE